MQDMLQTWQATPPDLLEQLARKQVSGDDGHISRNGAWGVLISVPMLWMATKRPAEEPFGHPRNVSSETADAFKKRRDLESYNVGWNQFCLGMLCGLHGSLYLSEFTLQFLHL